MKYILLFSLLFSCATATFASGNKARLSLVAAHESQLLAPPLAPSNLNVVAALALIALDWVDNSSDELGFRIERSSDGLAFDAIDSVNTDINYYTDNTVSPSTHYYYRVAAYNVDGLSGYTNVKDTVSVGVGIAAPLTRPALSVYPNPSAGVFQIGGIGYSTPYLVVDTQGNKVLEGVGSSVNLSGKAEGVYFLVVFDQARSSKRSLIVKY